MSNNTKPGLNGFRSLVGEKTKFYTWTRRNDKCYWSGWIVGNVKLYNKIANSKNNNTFNKHCDDLSRWEYK